MEKSINDRIFDVMSITFEIPMDKLNENSSKDDIEEWDSLKHLNLVLALEEEFGINIPDEEVGDMISFKLIKLIIDECSGRQN
jgi:acyl carrier protein